VGADLDAARAQLQERKTQFELEKQPLLEEERLSLEASVKQARDVVERSERRHAREVAGKELEIEGLELQITHAKQDMEDRTWELEQVRIYAPADGVVRLIRRQDRGSRTWETILVGRQTWGRDVLADLVDPNELTLRILVHESDILRIQPGQTAQIHLTAYPESTLSGKVLSVTALGQDRADLTPIYRQAPPAMQAQFLAEISVDLGDVPARAGMTAFGCWYWAWSTVRSAISFLTWPSASSNSAAGSATGAACRATARGGSPPPMITPIATSPTSRPARCENVIMKGSAEKHAVFSAATIAGLPACSESDSWPAAVRRRPRPRPTNRLGSSAATSAAAGSSIGRAARRGR
jgi:hypothetical protein